jgi:nucleoside phosphorylase
VSPDVLILAAFDPEIAPIRRAVAVAGAPGCEVARVGDHTIALATTGVGLAASAAGAACRIVELAPRAVVLVGTCGAYASAGLAIAEVVVARRLRLVDPVALDGLTEFPEPMQVALDADASLAGGLAADGARLASVATTLGITVDDALAARLGGAGHEVEHLETHGVAAACAPAGVPFAAVLGVANPVGSRGRADWRAHHREAEQAACDCVVEWLRRGAPGLRPAGEG